MTVPSFNDFTKEIVFNFKYKDELIGKEYSGEFVAKRPTILNQLEIQKEASLLRGEIKDLDSGIESFLYMLAYIKIVVIQSPSWFFESNYVRDLYDAEIVPELFNDIQERMAKQVIEVTKTTESNKETKITEADKEPNIKQQDG